MKKATHSEELKDAVLQKYLFVLRVSQTYYTTELESFSLAFKFQVENIGKEGFGFWYGQPALVPIIITIEELLDVLQAFFTSILASPLNSSLIVVENYTQQYVHQEKHAKNNE